MTLYTKSPAVEPVAGHEPPEKELQTFAYLDDLGIPYTWAAHEPLMTMEACEAVDAAFGFHICKNLFLCNQQKTVFYLLLMPGDKPFKTKYLSKELGISRLSFADETQLAEYLNLTPGSVTVMGLIFDKECRVNLLIDRALLQYPEFGCHPCINTATLKIRTDDLLKRFLPATGHTPTYVELLPPEEDKTGN